MINQLKSPFTIEEVILAMNNLKSNASPGLDGFTTLFYQSYWNIVGEDIISTILEILNNTESPKRFNKNFIIIIPKVKNLPKLLNIDILLFVMFL